MSVALNYKNGSKGKGNCYAVVACSRKDSHCLDAAFPGLLPVADRDASKPAVLGIVHSDDANCRHVVLAQRGQAKLQRLMRCYRVLVLHMWYVSKQHCTSYTSPPQSMLQPLLLHVKMAGIKLPGEGG